ncbi:hypothetical protein Pla100_21680 [Neorhodopirellula pilleata]|uniref:Uncharacterized protein n=1 Tax=Neorhodopirellula pilleata TaxID=2714738 RepID=A0A5C6AIV9_9BACT|nr:hypothetical protein Pla100_21680 [Neorhodopirellula pilleata]
MAINPSLTHRVTIKPTRRCTSGLYTLPSKNTKSGDNGCRTYPETIHRVAFVGTVLKRTGVNAVSAARELNE